MTIARHFAKLLGHLILRRDSIWHFLAPRNIVTSASSGVVIGLPLKFESQGWSEFATGDVTLALHPASEKNVAGTLQMGFQVANLEQFHAEMQSKGVKFAMPPTKQDFGGPLAQLIDSEGAHVSVSAS